MLHGCTQDLDDMAAGTRMKLLVKDQTFLVARAKMLETGSNPEIGGAAVASMR